MRERFVLQTAPQNIFPGDQRQILDQSQDPQNLDVGPDGNRGITILNLVESGTRNAGPGTDRLHGKAATKPRILETLPHGLHFFC